MRILVASGQWFPDRKGGSARVTADLAVGLARRGHELDVIVPRVRSRPRVEEVEPGVVLHRVLPRTVLPVTLSDVEWTRRAARALRHRRFDILLGHHSSNAFGLWAARLGAPLVYLYHASGARELRFLRSRLSGPARLASYPLEAALVALERVVLRRAASDLIALSEFSRSLIVADHGEHGTRVQLLPVGVDLDHFCPGNRDESRNRLGLADDRPLLVTVRRLEPRMGLESLVRAVARLAPKRRLTLSIVGAGSLEGELRRLVETLGVESEVRLVGRVSEVELSDWYRSADLFVLPTAAYEGFGMVTAEALASGTPVVGTPVGATPELLAPLDPRLVAPGTDVDALAAAVDSALDIVGPDLRRRCRLYAQERFDPRRAAERWEEALVDVAHRNGAGPSTASRPAPVAPETPFR